MFYRDMPVLLWFRYPQQEDRYCVSGAAAVIMFCLWRKKSAQAPEKQAAVLPQKRSFCRRRRKRPVFRGAVNGRVRGFSDSGAMPGLQDCLRLNSFSISAFSSATAQGLPWGQKSGSSVRSHCRTS